MPRFRAAADQLLVLTLGLGLLGDEMDDPRLADPLHGASDLGTARTGRSKGGLLRPPEHHSSVGTEQLQQSNS